MRTHPIPTFFEIDSNFFGAMVSNLLRGHRTHPPAQARPAPGGARRVVVLQWVGPMLFDNCGIPDGAEHRARSEVLPSGKQQSR